MAALVEFIFTLEWSYPYCSNPDSGPAFVARGMPLPYKVYSGVSSMEHFFMPHVYVANLMLLAALAYPICYLLAAGGRGRAAIAGVAGLLSILFVGALLSLSLSIRLYIPVNSIADGGFMRYLELRPVSFGFNVNDAADCQASTFWFPQGWQPR
jgi:hypothetical protein